MQKFNRRQFGAASLAVLASASLSRAALAEDNAIRMTFVLTNDLYQINEADGRGGLPRLAAILKAERASGNTTLFTHAGDALSPSLLAGFDQGAGMMSGLNLLRPDIFVPGNHEFDFGKQIFLQRMAEAQFPRLAANLRMPDGGKVPAFIDQMMIEVVGVKIGISGTTLDETPKMSNPGDLIITDSLTTLVDQAKSLRVAGADLAVAIVHADKPLIQRLIQSKAYDIVISGHNHDVALDYDRKILAAESGEDAKHVLCIDLVMSLKQARDKRSFTWWPNIRLIDSASVTPDADVLSKVKSLEAKLSSELDQQIAMLSVDLDSREASVRTGETAIGNLFSDALRDAMGADIAILNGGGIRGDKTYAAGTPLLRRDILTELPFGNRSVSINITGKALKEALENGLSQTGRLAGRFPQISGMKVVANRAAAAGSRLASVEVNGAPLDEARLYKVATNDYLLRGGDGYSALAAASASADTGARLIALDVINYIARTGEVSAKIDGRLVLN